MAVRVVLLGFGNVGKAFLRLLLDKEELLLTRYDLKVQVVGIATRSRGVVADPKGLDLRACLAASSLPGQGATELEDAQALLAYLDGQCDAVLEAINASHSDGEPALTLLQSALSMSSLPAHAITASKPPVAFGYRRLSELAARHGRRFLFESSVMDGVPVFSLLRQLPGACIRRVSGILNSTTNLILTRMDSTGCSLEEALSFAQEEGIAERDPSDDLDGKDAAMKICCLSAVAFRRDLDPAQVSKDSIRGITLSQVRAATARGNALKMVCEAELVDGEVRAAVSLMELPLADPLCGLTGASAAVTVETDVLGPVTVTSTNPTTLDTAYGLLQDLLTAVLVKLEGGEEKSFLLEEEKLRRLADGLPELPLQFKEMPDSSSSDAEHFVKMRARNLGGWSTWSEEVVTSSIARQQGADNAQRALEQAMERRVPEDLMKVLKDVRDIEFDDKTLVSEATELLETLQAVQTKAEQILDPQAIMDYLAVIVHSANTRLSQLRNAYYKVQTGMVAGMMESYHTWEKFGINMKGDWSLPVDRALESAVHKNAAGQKRIRLPASKVVEDVTCDVASSALTDDQVLVGPPMQIGAIVPSDAVNLQEWLAELARVLSQAVLTELTCVGEAMLSREPEHLQHVLGEAHKVALPGLQKAEALLHHLQTVCKNLDTAKGIDALRAALRDGHEARLPAAILQRAVQRLGTREAAQQGLDMAMEAARVPVLRAALDTAKDMHLPSEEGARSLLEAITHSENLLQASLISRDIRDLQRALDSSDKSGLREDELIMRAQKLLARQIEARDDAAFQLKSSMEAPRNMWVVAKIRGP
eukprot:s3066_g6.t2